MCFSCHSKKKNKFYAEEIKWVLKEQENFRGDLVFKAVGIKVLRELALWVYAMFLYSNFNEILLVIFGC